MPSKKPAIARSSQMNNRLDQKMSAINQELRTIRQLNSEISKICRRIENGNSRNRMLAEKLMVDIRRERRLKSQKVSTP